MQHSYPSAVLLQGPNRVADGSYWLGPADYRVQLTEPDRRSAMHGLVRDSAWQVVEHIDDTFVAPLLSATVARLSNPFSVTSECTAEQKPARRAILWRATHNMLGASTEIAMWL